MLNAVTRLRGGIANQMKPEMSIPTNQKKELLERKYMKKIKYKFKNGNLPIAKMVITPLLEMKNK